MPLVGAYLLLATLYAWQAWRRETPTIFSDELETTQISRAIAETGHAARRGSRTGSRASSPGSRRRCGGSTRSRPHTRRSRPSRRSSWRRRSSRRSSSPDACCRPAGRTSPRSPRSPAPALSYAPILVEEPWAYPAATLAFWLLVRAVDRPARWPIALAVGSCLLAVLVRSQLVALFGALGFGLVALGWRTEPMRRWRATWSRWDWVGAVVLGVGAVVAVVAFLGHHSTEWSTARPCGRAGWSSTEAGRAVHSRSASGSSPRSRSLPRSRCPRAERDRPGVRAFVIVSGGAVVSFGWYAAVKGAYLSTNFSSLIVERNLVYLAPLAFVATAYLLERGAAPIWSVVVAGAAVLGLVVWVPIERGLDSFPYYEAHGLAILALANREWAWPLGRIETAVEVVTVVGTVVVLLVGTRLRTRLSGIAAPVAIGTAVALLVWNVTAEVYASIGEHDFSARVERNIPKPNDWVDRAAGSGSVTMLGQHMSDNPLGVSSTEFWNRSIAKVWSVDGTGPGPGHTLTPDLLDAEGTLWPNPRTDLVLASGGVEVVGDEVAANQGSTLVRLDGNPIRLRSNTTGIAGDGWMVGDPGNPEVPARAAYNRFDVSGGGTGTAVVTLSRQTFCPAGAHLPGEAVVRIGILGRGKDKQPAILRQTASDTQYVPACGFRTFVLPTPSAPWRVEVAIQTFVPSQVDPKGSAGERRALGARVSFDVVPR